MGEDEVAQSAASVQPSEEIGGRQRARGEQLGRVARTEAQVRQRARSTARGRSLNELRLQVDEGDVRGGAERRGE
eukprot:5049323-Prymnesium_polylepis.1